VNVDAEVGKIDALLALLGECQESQVTRIAGEHLQGARIYLLGAMTNEYKVNLDLARQAAGAISDHGIRQKANHIVSGLMEAEQVR